MYNVENLVYFTAAFRDLTQNLNHKKPYLGQLLAQKRIEPGLSQIKLGSYHYTALLGTKNEGGREGGG
jgi:hypothetical protein